MVYQDNKEHTTPANECQCITPAENAAASKFLKCEVENWLKHNPTEPFSARKLVGGSKGDWGPTPLQPIYLGYLENLGKERAIKASKKAVGHLLKKVLMEDKRRFDREYWGNTWNYQWDGNP